MRAKMKRSVPLLLSAVLTLPAWTAIMAQDEPVAEEAAPAEDDTVLDGATEAPEGEGTVTEDAAVESEQPTESAPAAPAAAKPGKAAVPKADPAKPAAKPAAATTKPAPAPVVEANEAETETEGEGEEEGAGPDSATEAAPSEEAAASTESPPDTTPEGDTSAGAPPQFTQDGEKRYDALGDGQRLKLRDGELSLIAPLGWELLTTLPSLTLQATVPSNTPNLKYPRTIQIMRFEGPKYMDDLTAQAFEGFITTKFSTAGAGVDAFKVKNHLPIDMMDGRKGLLYYTEFVLGGMPLMQAHILISSQKAHFLLSFTDVAEHFENEDQNSRYLTEAWQAMTSVELDTPSPVQFEAIARIGVGFAALILLCVAIWAVRNSRAKKQYAYYGAGKGLDDVEVTREPTLVGGKAGAAPASNLGMSFHGDEEK